MKTRMVAAAGWRYQRHGAPSKVLRFENFRIPFDRAGGDVVVKMLAAPVHRHDKNMIEGTFGLPAAAAAGKGAAFPAVAGVEGVGIVEEVGGRATLGVREGDLVWVNNPRVGTWATHVVTDSENLDVVPNRADVPLEFLAASSVFHTAYHLTNSLVKISPGDVVLQTGAAGAVAQVCQGMVRARGAKLVQTLRAGRTNHLDILTHAKLRGAYIVVPTEYARSTYMRRLLSDLPEPKVLLNGSGGLVASELAKLLGDNGTVLTYGNASGQPLQVPAAELLMRRGVQFRGFSFPAFSARQSRAARMLVHQNCVESMTLAQGHSNFFAMRFKMNPGDSPFAFASSWDTDLPYRKPILRMVGEYGEWRKPTSDVFAFELAQSIWDDLAQQQTESSGAVDVPQSMKYYTPIGEYVADPAEQVQIRELGMREVFFRRPHAPRNNTHEAGRKPAEAAA